MYCELFYFLTFSVLHCKPTVLFPFCGRKMKMFDLSELFQVVKLRLYFKRADFFSLPFFVQGFN